MLIVNERIQIPLSEFEFSFARSSGPGGQNVNKVSSKAQLRWAVAASPSLPADVRARLLARVGSRLTNEGELLVTSQRHRDQQRNINDCLEKVRLLVAAAATPAKRRRKTRPTRASVERRLDSKGRTSRRKQERRTARRPGRGDAE